MENMSKMSGIVWRKKDRQFQKKRKELTGLDCLVKINNIKMSKILGHHINPLNIQLDILKLPLQLFIVLLQTSQVTLRHFQINVHRLCVCLQTHILGPYLVNSISQSSYLPSQAQCEVVGAMYNTF